MEIKSLIIVPIDTIQYRNNYFADVYKVMINGEHLGYNYKDTYLENEWFDMFSPLAPNANNIWDIRGSENGYYCQTIDEVKYLYENNLLG